MVKASTTMMSLQARLTPIAKLTATLGPTLTLIILRASNVVQANTKIKTINQVAKCVSVDSTLAKRVAQTVSNVLLANSILTTK